MEIIVFQTNKYFIAQCFFCSNISESPAEAILKVYSIISESPAEAILKEYSNICESPAEAIQKCLFSCERPISVTHS